MKYKKGFLMNPIKIILIVSIFSLVMPVFGKGGKRKITGDNACKSSKLCTYSRMPLIKQGGRTLKWYIQKRTGNWSLIGDTGWCGATSLGMGWMGISTHNPKIRWNSWLDSKPKSNEYVWQAGQDSQTDWEDGGTYQGDAADGIKKRLRGISKKTRERYVYQDYPMNPILGEKEIKAKIRKYKSVAYAGLARVKVKYVRTLSPALNFEKKIKQRFQKVGYYEQMGDTAGFHAVMINGYDGRTIIVYDPWGRVYTVSMWSYVFAQRSYHPDFQNLMRANSRTRLRYRKIRQWDFGNFSKFVTRGAMPKTQTHLTSILFFSAHQK